MIEYVHTGAVMLLVSLVGWILHRGLGRISGQVASVADSLGRHIVEDDKRHADHVRAIQELWRAPVTRAPR